MRVEIGESPWWWQVFRRQSVEAKRPFGSLPFGSDPFGYAQGSGQLAIGYKEGRTNRPHGFEELRMSQPSGIVAITFAACSRHPTPISQRQKPLTACCIRL
ncbi:hypothetical protein QUB05_17825 [Microcoleus sp. F10-C6]|uniref:hypothetical protein n=1 Tax=unclassified Microcoleus TaxID=2642155 RepID=UPI002FD65972